MPTNFVKGKKDEELWDKAKEIVQKEYKLTEKNGEEFWSLVTGVYKKSGGEIANAKESPVITRRAVIDTLFKSREINEKVYANYKGTLTSEVQSIVKEFEVNGDTYFVRFSDSGKRTAGYELVDAGGYLIGGTTGDGKNVSFPEFKKSAKEVEDHVTKFISGGGTLRRK